MTPGRRGARIAGLVLAASCAAAAGRWALGGPTPQVKIPVVDEGTDTLPARAAAQQKDAASIRVVHDFHFQDRVAESGITFVQHPTDDSGKYYKAVHYDHGNGVIAGDVDGDGLPDLYFVSQLGGNELWKNLGHGKFRNITKEAGVAVPGRIGVTASFADVDNDGDLDLFVTTVRGGDILFENDGKGHFKDITKAAGLEYVGHSSGAVFFDYDNDGKLDLFLVNVGKYTTEEKGRGGYFVGYSDAFSGHLHPDRTESCRLYHNLGNNRFEDVTERAGLKTTSWSGDASVADVNGDGFPDLYVLNMQGDDHFYVNEKGQRFVDRTAEYFPKTPWGAMGIKFFDFDNDGRVDLLLTDMHSDMSQEIGPAKEKEKSEMKWNDAFLQGGANNIFGNAFYRNLGDGRFEEISDRVGAENYWPWGPSVGDLNADGFDDVFIASGMSFPFRYGIDTAPPERPRRALPRRRVPPRRRAARQRNGGALLPARLRQGGSGPAGVQGPDGQDHGARRPQHALRRHLRRGRRRGSGHRDERVQRPASGSHLGSVVAASGALPGGRSRRKDLEPARARRARDRFGRRADVHQVERRQVGLPLAERAAALFRAGRRDRRGPRRGAVAVGPQERARP